MVKVYIFAVFRTQSLGVLHEDSHVAMLKYSCGLFLMIFLWKLLNVVPAADKLEKIVVHGKIFTTRFVICSVVCVCTGFLVRVHNLEGMLFSVIYSAPRSITRFFL